MQIYLSRPDITDKEINAVCDVLHSPNLSLGPRLAEFETFFAAYIGCKHGVAVNSGTSGLFLSLLALNIGPGDEVITTPFTFISSATSIMMTGARPVFVDIDPVTLNMEPDHIASVITPQTKAVLPVEVFGNPAGMDRVRDIARQANLAVIEDSCEALGSSLNGQKAGTFGDMCVFAFYPNKQITTGEGGMILTNHDHLADMCVSLRNQGRRRGDAWLCHERLGYNYRLSDINCALGIAQLSRIKEIIAKRNRVAAWYQDRLCDEERLIIPSEPQGCSINWFVYVVRLQTSDPLNHRNQCLSLLREQGIQVGNYFPPVHLQPFMAHMYGYKPGDFPVAESVSQRTIALPFYNNLKETDVDLVCQALKNALDKL
jgi:perosamine synthetase